MSEPSTSEPTTPPPTPPPTPTGKNPAVEVVERFLDALRRLDTDAALALLAQDVVYQNVSLPAAHGKAAVAKQLGMFARYATGFDAINHRIVGEGNVVLTERTDIIEINRLRTEFWVCGTFEVRDGLIVLWRDYFDWANILTGTVKGAGRALVGAVRNLRR